LSVQLVSKNFGARTRGAQLSAGFTVNTIHNTPI